MPTREAIIAELSTLGRGKLENFNMGERERLDHVAAMPVHGYSPTAGYCHGVCRDWIRRVLQGGRARFGPNPERNADEAYDYNVRRQEQAKRQGYAWASFSNLEGRSLEIANALMASNNADYDRAYETYAAVNTMLLAVHAQLIEDYNRHVNLGEAHVVTVNYGAKLLRIFPTLKSAPATLSVKSLRTLYKCVEQSYQALQPPVKATVQRADVDQRTFAQFTKDMDANFSKKKKKKFGGIALIHAHPQKPYAELSAAIASVTDPAPTDFSSGRAIIVGFGMRNGNDDSGHALAVHWRAENCFILLDPNYGMFTYERLAGVKSVSSALTYLFGTAYPGQSGVRVTNGVSYEIYAKRDA